MKTNDRRTLGVRHARWIVLLVAMIPAAAGVSCYPSDIDEEYPQVTRPVFSKLPPYSYRLAEPGDTIDLVGVYMASVATVLSLAGILFVRDPRGATARAAALSVSLALYWYAATPGPTFDGWHGVGWRTLQNPDAPPSIRLILSLFLLLLVVFPAAVRIRAARRAEVSGVGVRSTLDRPLLAIAFLFILFRFLEVPNIEPFGYWPRWFFVWGVLALNLALSHELIRRGDSPFRVRDRRVLPLALCVVLLVIGGRTLSWYHRPLERLRAVAPGRIYISALPTISGLKIAHERHRFKTIINLFRETGPEASPTIDQEIRFAREHGIRYVANPTDPSVADDFLDETLRLAQDPGAWPILVHCHACMDRSPAWMGIYRFLVEKRPLLEIIQEIERHRGLRPKAVVTLLYNKVLAERDPERYAADPTAQSLIRHANGVDFPEVSSGVREDEQTDTSGAEPQSELSRLERSARANTGSVRAGVASTTSPPSRSFQ